MLMDPVQLPNASRTAPHAGRRHPNDEALQKIEDVFAKIGNIRDKIQKASEEREVLKGCPATLIGVLGLAMIVAAIACIFIGGGFYALTPLLIIGGLLVTCAINWGQIRHYLQMKPYTIRDPMDELMKHGNAIQRLVEKPPRHRFGVNKGQVDAVRARKLMDEYLEEIKESKKYLKVEIARFRGNQDLKNEEKDPVVNEIDKAKSLMDMVREMKDSLAQFDCNALAN
jgi:hypothetical protein